MVALQNQVGAQILVVRKLEEKERLLQSNLATVEKELKWVDPALCWTIVDDWLYVHFSLRQQALELNKRKAIEAAQSAADLKLQVGKLQEQLNEAQAGVAEKTATMEEESFKINRLQVENLFDFIHRHRIFHWTHFQEEISMLKKKLERAKKIEKADTADEVLLEEIRELKVEFNFVNLSLSL